MDAGGIWVSDGGADTILRGELPTSPHVPHQGGGAHHAQCPFHGSLGERQDSYAGYLDSRRQEIGWEDSGPLRPLQVSPQEFGGAGYLCHPELH